MRDERRDRDYHVPRLKRLCSACVGTAGGQETIMVDVNMLATVASIIAGFGSVMLAFRLEREVLAGDEGEQMWVAWADWLIIAATLLCLLSLLPIVSGYGDEMARVKWASAGTTAAVILTLGYVPSILAHYRLIFAGHRQGPRQNPEPAERWLTVGSGLCAVIVFAWRIRGVAAL